MSFVLLEFRELFALRPYGPEQKTEVSKQFSEPDPALDMIAGYMSTFSVKYHHILHLKGVYDLVKGLLLISHIVWNTPLTINSIIILIKADVATCKVPQERA